MSLGEALLAPTTIYNQPLLALQKTVGIKAMAHITGGGILENPPCVLPQVWEHGSIATAGHCPRY